VVYISKIEMEPLAGIFLGNVPGLGVLQFIAAGPYLNI
jgi:hypothetical protein